MLNKTSETIHRSIVTIQTFTYYISTCLRYFIGLYPPVYMYAGRSMYRTFVLGMLAMRRFYPESYIKSGDSIAQQLYTSGI